MGIFPGWVSFVATLGDGVPASKASKQWGVSVGLPRVGAVCSVHWDSGGELWRVLWCVGSLCCLDHVWVNTFGFIC